MPTHVIEDTSIVNEDADTVGVVVFNEVSQTLPALGVCDVKLVELDVEAVLFKLIHRLQPALFVSRRQVDMPL